MAEKEVVSPVADWYENRTVFITGGSGFMGKVLVEKLLFTCHKIKSIYLLLREKRGKSAQQRLEDMWKLPVFERLRNKDPEAIKKIRILNGDVNTKGLGLSKEDVERLVNDVSVVFHCAATLKLEANLHDAVEQNTAGTKRVLDVCRGIKNLKAFIHYSTAFCSVDIDVFEEKVYDCKDDPELLIKLVEWMKPEALDHATPYIIDPHPNTYTYTKRLAEKLVADEAENMPVCIIRPSIVTPSIVEPIPGWVDNLNGPMGLVVGGGKGVIRSMYCKGEYRAQLVPVDIAIAATIIAAQKLGSSPTRPKEVPVYNLTQDGVVQLTWADLLKMGKELIFECPFDGQLWYPDGDIRSSKLWHNILCIFLHWIPALLIDCILFLLCQKRFMIRLQKKVHQGLELLQFFTTREWYFKYDNFYALSDYITEDEKKIFLLDFKRLPVREYIKIALLGARQYCMKEPLSSLPRSRIQIKLMYVLHKVAVYFFWYWILSTIIHSNSTLENAFNTLGESLKDIPILNYLIPTKS